MLNFGGFLSSNFWTNYRCSSSASVEDLLSSKDCTVDKLLDDDDCLQEFKNYNDKLIKYFDHDKLKVLVDYITVMPEKDEQKRGHKYPFIAGEIFNCEINQILDKFFEAPVKVKPQPALTPSESATEVTTDSAAKENEEEKKEETKEEVVEADKDATVAEDKTETKDAGETATAEDTPDAKETEESKEESKEEGDKKLEETPQRLETDDKEEKAEATEESKEVADAEPPQDGESKEETEVPAVASPEAEVPAPAKEAEKEDEKKDEKEAEKTDASDATDKNTQEPESEEPDKENAEVKPVDATAKPATPPAVTEAVEEKKASEEPEEEDTSKKTDEKPEKDLASMASFSTLQTEAQDEEEDDEEEGNKYVLLERLFKFIRTEGDEDLNPVLSGYFCKLVSLLISRKQKQLFPFIFAKDSTVIEDLLKHVYQKSISEILNKLLTLVDSDHEPEILAEVKAKQQMAVGHLIDSLGPEKSEEHNLNACTIIQDMFEIKEFYNLICGKDNLTRIVEFSLAGMSESTKSSKCSSLTVLNQIVLNHIERQKKKEQKTDEDKDNGHDEDDDMIVQQNSDDEAADDLEASNPNSAAAQTAVLVDILKEKVGAIAVVLRPDHEGATIKSSVNEADYVPLGQQRLHTIELVLRMVQLKKEALYTPLGRSATFGNIMDLVKKYPWNNFMQLKVITMCEEILENCESEDFKKAFLEGSGIGKALIAMGAEAAYKMNSERLIRNGYMGLVVSVSNKLIKRFKGTTNKPEDATVVEYLDNVGEEWRAFVDDELANSNTNDNKTLGGSTKPEDGGSEGGDDHDPNNIDDQMEKIMQRFSNFNQMLTSGSNGQDDDEEDEGEDAEESVTLDEDGKEDGDKEGSMKVEKVDLKEVGPLNSEFIDNSYWNLTQPQENEEDIDYDSLLAELEN